MYINSPGGVVTSEECPRHGAPAVRRLPGASLRHRAPRQGDP
jgi:hypothetical protein